MVLYSYDMVAILTLDLILFCLHLLPFCRDYCVFRAMM